jgi:hypothetical protein
VLAAATLVVAAIAALGERCYTVVRLIRRSGAPRRRVGAGHPRVFARDR